MVNRPEDVFSDMNIILYTKAAEYYQRDTEAAEIDLDTMKAIIKQDYPRHYEAIAIAIDRIDGDSTISVNNVVGVFIEARKTVIGQLLAGAILNGEDTTELIAEYRAIQEGDTGSLTGEPQQEVVVGLSSSSMEESLDPANSIDILPAELGERIKGKARKGHHVLVYARPETGKSLFVINMARGFIEAGHKTLYIGNEDPESSMRIRMRCSLLDMSEEEINELAKDALDDMVSEAGADNLLFVHLTPGTFSQIRSLCRIHKPDILIVDQIRNIHSGGDGLVNGQEKAGTEMRNIAGEFDLLAVSVAQAGESASGKLVLGLSDVDSSKTGLPAQVDLMIGIGITDEYEQRGKRMISLPKNKLSGDHSFFSISVDKHKSRVL